MSEQEKKSGANIEVMDQSASSRHKQPYRPTELQEEATDLHHKRSRAPAVPSVAEELKNLTEDNANENTEAEPENEHVSFRKNKEQSAPKKSSQSKKADNQLETIALANIEVENRKGIITPPSQPIPANVETVASASGVTATNKLATQKEKKGDEDSITEEIDELRTTAQKKHSEWSDDEEAGGLPRSESRASRMSRAVRQMFCCGVPYEAPSEDNISMRRGFARSGI